MNSTQSQHAMPGSPVQDPSIKETITKGVAAPEATGAGDTPVRADAAQLQLSRVVSGVALLHLHICLCDPRLGATTAPSPPSLATDVTHLHPFASGHVIQLVL